MVSAWCIDHRAFQQNPSGFNQHSPSIVPYQGLADVTKLSFSQLLQMARTMPLLSA